MLRVLSACVAIVSKSLQWLDYIALDGVNSFEDLCGIVDELKVPPLDKHMFKGINCATHTL